MSIRDLTPWNWGRKPSGANGNYHPIQALHDRVERLFEDFFTGWGGQPLYGSAANNVFVAPRIDVAENDKEYRYSAELPGVDEKDVEVTLSDGTLTIKGEKNVESKEEDDHYLRAERSYGSFQRTLTLPSDADPDKVKAAFAKGVLTVTVGKSATAKSATKRIEVRSS